MTVVDNIIARAASRGLRARAWRKHGFLRLYLDPAPKGGAVWVELADEDASEAALGARVTATKVSPRWRAAAVGLLKEQARPLLLAAIYEGHKATPIDAVNLPLTLRELITEARAYFGDKNDGLPRPVQGCAPGAAGRALRSD